MTTTRDRSRTRLTTVVLLLLALAVLAIVLLARQGGASTSVVDGVVEVTMEDYAFDATSLTVPVEEPVTFRLVNRDEVSHHLSFGRGLVEEGPRVLAFEDDLFAGLDPRVRPTNAVVDLAPPQDTFTVLVQGGSTVEVDVMFPADRAGAWQIGCFTGRGCHYRAGLEADLTLR